MRQKRHIISRLFIKHFGYGNDSPRWKVRAFFDYFRDVFANINRLPLIRVTVCGLLNTDNSIRLTGNILKQQIYNDLKKLVKFIEQRQAPDYDIA